MVRMDNSTVKPASERVNALVVAAFLGVTNTTVYALVRGVRGWKNIERLPHFENPDQSRRNRYTFDLNAVAAWRERTGFQVQPQGRGRRKLTDNAVAA